MPRSTPTIPKYSLHKPSGRARVRIDGRDIYLGPYGSAESKEAYNRVIAEHLAGGARDARTANCTVPKSVKLSPETFDMFDRPALRLVALSDATDAAA